MATFNFVRNEKHSPGPSLYEYRARSRSALGTDWPVPLQYSARGRAVTVIHYFNYKTSHPDKGASRARARKARLQTNNDVTSSIMAN